MTEFKQGDKVRTKNGNTVIAEWGPYEYQGGPTYTVRSTTQSDHVYPMAADSLEPIPPADPRVDVVAMALAESDGETFGGAYDAGTDECYRVNARAVLTALDAHSGKVTVTYSEKEERPRRVRDRDGDDWVRQEPRGLYKCAATGTVGTREMINELYGPLTTLED